MFLEVSATTLEKRAAQLGTVAGEAVALLRDVRTRLQAPGGSQDRDDRLGQLGAAARAKVDELRRQAAAHAEHWRQAAQEKAAELQRQAKTRYEQARTRTKDVIRDYPVHVVVVAGVAGFLLGVAVRAWRANRAG
jgi:ElaB/YqjD/DUF883 family membrane-anchored ribosome-binding protein